MIYSFEERKKVWIDFLDKRGLNFVSREDFFQMNQKIFNPLILPSPFLNKNIFEILKNKTDGEIYTEVLNLFYYIKVSYELITDSFYKYSLNLIDDIVYIDVINLNEKGRLSFFDRGFTPKGVEEFLKLNGFKLKEIWGDYPSGKIKDDSRFLLLRIGKNED